MLNRPEIEQWLTERGYSHDYIEKILEQVAKFDVQISRESLFDGIDAGEFNFDDLLKEE